MFVFPPLFYNDFSMEHFENVNNSSTVYICVFIAVLFKFNIRTAIFLFFFLFF